MQRTVVMWISLNIVYRDNTNTTYMRLVVPFDLARDVVVANWAGRPERIRSS